MAVLAECPVCRKKQSVRNKLCRCGENLDKAKRSEKVRFWISYRFPGGRQKRELVGFSIEEARDADGKRRVQKRENRIFDIKPEAKMTFNELTEWYLGLESVKRLARYETLTHNLRSFNKVFGETVVKELKPVDLENFQAKQKNQRYADAYVDQQIGIARTMINKAFDNDLVSGDTIRVFRKVKKLLRGDANARKRILSRAEFDRLMGTLPPHTRGVLAVGYLTGMRLGEILGLTWDKVDSKKRLIKLDPEDTKDREARSIPICNELYSVLEGIPKAIHDDHVFLYEGKPVKQILGSLRRACRRVGIAYGSRVKDGFVFHDTRHSFNTNMRKSGVPDSVIMKITGHSTAKMFRRYDTVDETDTRKAIDQLEEFLKSVDQNVDHTSTCHEGGTE